MRVARRFASSRKKTIYEEWKLNQKVNQPMPDPEGLPRSPRLSEILWQSPMNHFRAMRDAFVLYKKTLFDPEAAVREASIDDEFIRRATEKWSESGKTEAGASVVEKKDFDEIMEKVRAMYPEGLPKDLSGAVKELGSRKEDIKEVAVDRLEVMAEAIKEFMSGYREGKEESIKEVDAVTDEEAKTYIANLVDSVDKIADTSKEERNEKSSGSG